MKTYNKIFSGLILVMTFSAANAQSGLLLSGDTIGVFRPVASSTAAATGSSDSWASSFRTGVPMNNSFQSGVDFNRHDFANIRDGDIFSQGLITYWNGINRIGTSSGTALLDLFLRLDGSADLIPLATISLGIDATANSRGTPVPDIFRASFIQPEPIRLGDQWVKFTVTGLPASLQLGENTSLDLGSLTVTLIPEIPLAAIILGSATLGFTVYYRKRALAVG